MGPTSAVLGHTNRSWASSLSTRSYDEDGGNIYAAVQLLSRLAHLKLDLIYIGHAIGIAGCLGVHVDEFEKELIHNLDPSKNEHGESLLGLAAAVTAYVELEAWEFEILNSLEKDDEAEKASSGNLLQSWSRELVRSHGSTKTKVAVDLALHHIRYPKSPVVKFPENGAGMMLPSDCGKEGEGGPTKIVIFTEFPSLSQPLEDALTAYGLRCMLLVGTVTISKREKIIAEFNTCPEPCVIIMSSIGSTGINLSAAHIMILEDQQFSEQDKRQIMGRIWRYPQDKICIIYDLVAINTADVALNSIARKKEEMLQIFASRAKYAEALLARLRGEDSPDTEISTWMKGITSSTSTPVLRKGQTETSFEGERKTKSKVGKHPDDVIVILSSDDDAIHPPRPASSTTDPVDAPRDAAPPKQAGGDAAGRTESDARCPSGDEGAPPQVVSQDCPRDEREMPCRTQSDGAHGTILSGLEATVVFKAEDWPNHLHPVQLGKWFPARDMEFRAGTSYIETLEGAKYYDWDHIPEFDATKFGPFDRVAVAHPKDPCCGEIMAMRVRGWPNPPNWLRERNTFAMPSDIIICSTDPASWQTIHPTQVGLWYPQPSLVEAPEGTTDEQFDPATQYSYMSWPHYDANRFGPYDRLLRRDARDPQIMLIDALFKAGFPSIPPWLRTDQRTRSKAVLPHFVQYELPPTLVDPTSPRNLPSSGHRTGLESEPTGPASTADRLRTPSPRTLGQAFGLRNSASPARRTGSDIATTSPASQAAHAQTFGFLVPPHTRVGLGRQRYDITSSSDIRSAGPASPTVGPSPTYPQPLSCRPRWWNYRESHFANDVPNFWFWTGPIRQMRECCRGCNYDESVCERATSSSVSLLEPLSHGTDTDGMPEASQQELRDEDDDDMMYTPPRLPLPLPFMQSPPRLMYSLPPLMHCPLTGPADYTTKIA
ncbi:hypothetical protein BKA93DRAFT_826085 [Sparassis latifolia]